MKKNIHQIKQKTLQKTGLQISYSSKNLMDLPTQFQDGHIIVLQYNGKTQNIIAKKQLIDELIPYLKQIEKNIQQQTIQIRFTIQHDKLGNELKAKLKEFLSCVSTYDQESCLFTIELLKQDFENVTLVLKEFAQQYHKINFCEAKQIMNDLNQDSIDFRELEKNQKVIIYIQKFYTYDPIYASRSQLSYDNRKINLVQGKISEIQCQAVVLQFLKNYDYSNVILQDNQIKDILMQADDRSLLLKSWKKQMEQGNQLSDVKMMELSKTNYIKFLFQIYPQFYKNSSNLRKNLIHIQALIKEVFKQAKQNQIKQIAFPLIGVELFGYTVKAIQQVLVLQIISEFSQKDCSVDQVFVVDVCETNLNQLDEYFRSFQEQKRPDSALSSRQVNPSQIAQWQIEKGGDLIEIEDPEVNDLISNRYRLQNQSSNFEPLLINYRFSKVPHTHLVDMKNKKIFNIRIFKEQRIDFIELFQQRLYFIDYQQVDANLNRYLLIRHEQFQQEEFELFYLQDEVITVNTQFYIQTKGRDDKKKIIRSGKLSERQDWIESDCQAQNQANFTYQTIQANSKQHQPKINTFQLQISSDSEEKNEKALETIKKFHQMQTSNRQRNNQN